MAAILTIPKSNSLRFLDLAKINDLQNYDNRFIADLVYAKTLPYYWVQQFEQGDTLWFQFRTNYTLPNIKPYLVDADNNKTDLSPSINLIDTDSSGRTYYNVPVDLSSLNGCYRIELSASDFAKPDVTYLSEAFYVSDEVLDSIWIEWLGNEMAYDDQMIWSDLKQGLRILGRDREFTPEQNKTVYDNSDYAPITLKSKPIRNLLLEINNAPYWMIEKVNIGLSHDEFYVQGVQYNTEEVITPGKLGDLLTLKATVVLTQLNFEDGTDPEIVGDIETNFLKINDTDYLLINNSGDKLKIV